LIGLAALPVAAAALAAVATWRAQRETRANGMPRDRDAAPAGGRRSALKTVLAASAVGVALIVAGATATAPWVVCTPEQRAAFTEIPAVGGAMLEPKADEPSLTYWGTGGCIGAHGSPVHHHEIGTDYREALDVRGWQVEPPWPAYWSFEEDVLREHGLFEEVASALDVASDELPFVGVRLGMNNCGPPGWTWICSRRSRRCRRRMPGRGLTAEVSRSM
jgi:hypothetical protein